jgi:hypothetical protein
VFGECKKPHTPSHCPRYAPHNLRYVKCRLRSKVAASRNSSQKLYLAVMYSRSSPAGFRPLRSCPHFVSESVRYARVKFIFLFSPTAVRGLAFTLPCASRTPPRPRGCKKAQHKTKNRLGVCVKKMG